MKLIMANIIDGKAISAQIREEIAQKVSAYAERTGKRPGLAVIIVGENPASQVKNSSSEEQFLSV